MGCVQSVQEANDYNAESGRVWSVTLLVRWASFLHARFWIPKAHFSALCIIPSAPPMQTWAHGFAIQQHTPRCIPPTSATRKPQTNSLSTQFELQLSCPFCLWNQQQQKQWQHLAVLITLSGRTDTILPPTKSKFPLW